MWGTHMLSSEHLFLTDDSHHSIPAGDFLGNPAHLMAALFGLFAFIRTRKPTYGFFAPTMLITVIVVHLIHRPWWFSYHVHFAIPISLLGARGLAFLVEQSLDETAASEKDSVQLKFNKDLESFGFPGIALITAFFVFFEGPRVIDDVGSLYSKEKRRNSVIVEGLRKHGEETRWVYTTLRAHAFAAGLLLPPELLVTSQKRFWSGQISDDGVVELLRQYMPEQLLIDPTSEFQNPAMARFVQSSYVLLEQNGYSCIYVRSDLNPKRLLPPLDIAERAAGRQ